MSDQSYVSHGEEYVVGLADAPTVEAGVRAGLHAGAGDGLRSIRGVIATRRMEKIGSALREVTLKKRGAMSVAKPTSSSTRAFATASIVVGGAKSDDVRWLRTRGAFLVEEGTEGKLLFSVRTYGGDDVAEAFTISREVLGRGVAYAHPNFVRQVARPQVAKAAAKALWNHKMIGLVNAWKYTKGVPEIRVAILDEGVDTQHPELKPRVVAQRDFIGPNGDSAIPDGDDAHGTSCAGIVCASEAGKFPGIAPNVSLIAARIAMDDGTGHWVFDDFATADAIDWCWREKADVLSNSWGGGPPSDAIARAFNRAKTNGRNGKGAVVVIAAGNDETSIDFPGSLPGFVVVGATNERDERKTKTSQDAEPWWGSCFGPTISLLAPGINIATTDIVGAAGYSPTDHTTDFNGTSSATPHVAAAAALILSMRPDLPESDVQSILTSTAKKLVKQTKWTPELGHGRLDLGAALKHTKGLPGPATTAAKAATKPATAAQKATSTRKRSKRKLDK